MVEMPFLVSAWVKGGTLASDLPIFSKGAHLPPEPTRYPSLKLWLDAQDEKTLDKGSSLGASGIPQNNELVGFWKDKSGNNNDGTSTNGTFSANNLNNNLNSVSGTVTISNSVTEFDAWDSMTLFYVAKWKSSSWVWEENIIKGESFKFGKARIDLGEGIRLLRPHDFRASSTTRAYDWAKVVSFVYNGTNRTMKFFTNGNSAGSRDNSSSSVNTTFASNSDSLKIIGHMHWGDVIIYRNALSDSQRENIEGYLTVKYSLQDDLPSNHSWKNQAASWSMGISSGREAVLTSTSNVGGTKFTKKDIPANNWNHLVNTYDGSNLKLYLNGAEISSTARSGSISPSNAALLLGALDHNTTQPPEDTPKTVTAANHSKIKLDEVRFYNGALSAPEVTELYNVGKGDLVKVGGFSTLPSVINATPGTALSTTITADFPNALYSAYNLPDGLSFTGGLSINSATGEISGTPTVGGTHIITVVAQGGTSDAPKKTSTTIVYSAGTSGPKWGSAEATNIVGDSALLLAEIEQSGAESNTVDFVWDTVNRNSTTVSDWNSSALNVGSGKEGYYGKQLNNLTPGQTYYYRAKTSLNQNALDLIGNDMTLWLDASDLSSTPSTWGDKSGNSRNATKGGSPGVVTNAQNGLSLMRFTGDGQKYEWTELTDIRTVFWVLKENASAQHANGSTEFRYLLNDSVQRQINGSNVNPHFHNERTNDYFWHTGLTDNKITGGTTRLNGTTVNGAATNIPTSLAVVSLKTTGNVIASSFGYDRGNTSRQWLGDLAELIICDTALSDSDIQKVEGYLAHKWGLQSSLPSSGHSYKSSPPQSTVWSSIKYFTTPINTSAPTLGTQSTANITATAADLEVVLTDNGNAATTRYILLGR